MNCLKGRNCFACGYDINERFMLFSDNKYWHAKGCLRCEKCGVDLGSERSDSSVWVKSGMYLCKKDYLSLSCRYCSGCKLFIPSDAYVVKISSSLVFHVHCLCCSKCKHSLKTGDRFLLTNDGQGILCFQNCARSLGPVVGGCPSGTNGETNTAGNPSGGGKASGKRGRAPLIKK